MIDDQRRAAGLVMRERAQRHLAAAGRTQIDVIELARIALELRRHLQHHVILVELGEHGRDLALAERVVERVVDGRGRDAEARGGVAIDHQMRIQAVVLLIGRDIAQLRAGLSACRPTSRSRC